MEKLNEQGLRIDGKSEGYVILERGEVCESCKSAMMKGQRAQISGFGGYANPIYYFMCEDCVDDSEAAYEASCLDAEIYQDQCWDNY